VTGGDRLHACLLTVFGRPHFGVMLLLGGALNYNLPHLLRGNSPCQQQNVPLFLSQVDRHTDMALSVVVVVESGGSDRGCPGPAGL
jgi:hypothetical protein